MPRSDPRVREILSSVNGEIADRAIRHALFLEGLKTHEVNKIIHFLNSEVFPDLVETVRKQLEAGIVLTFSAERLRNLIKATDQVIRVGMRAARNGFAKELYEIAVSESEWQAAILSKATPKIFGIDFITPSPQYLRTIVHSKPFGSRGVPGVNMTLGKWWNKLANDTKTNLTKAIKFGMVEGESIPQIMSRIRGTRARGYKDGILDVCRRDAEAIARTAVANVSNTARAATFSENSDVVKGWRYVATLDARTTPICMSLDGQTFDIGEGAARRPPQHFNCRSTMAPITKSWKELGFNDFKDTPPGKRFARMYPNEPVPHKNVREFKKATAQMTGKVPANMKYPEWLKGQPLWVQEKALGKRRALLFRQGKLDIQGYAQNKGWNISRQELMKIDV